MEAGDGVPHLTGAGAHIRDATHASLAVTVFVANAAGRNGASLTIGEDDDFMAELQTERWPADSVKIRTAWSPAEDRAD